MHRSGNWHADSLKLPMSEQSEIDVPSLETVPKTPSPTETLEALALLLACEWNEPEFG